MRNLSSQVSRSSIFSSISVSSPQVIKSTTRAINLGMSEITGSATPTTGNGGKKVISLVASCSPYQIEAFREIDHGREHFGVDPRYLKVPLSLTPEALHLVCRELEKIFFEDVALRVRHEDRFRGGWLVNGTITKVDTPRLTDFELKPDYLMDFFNKEIMVYFESDSGTRDGRGKIIRYIYREWLRLHGGRPSFQRGGFFAKPIQIHSTGPQGLDQITTFHHDLSNYITTRSQDLVHFKQWDYKPPRFSTKPKEESPELQNDSEVKSWQDHRFMVGHLFPALYMVSDDQCLPEPSPHVNPEGLHGNDRIYYLEGVVEREMAKCTVLLVKTGDEAHLSAPVSFEPLFDAGLALNVNRDDCDDGYGDGETAVRVNLDVAVRFLWGLLQKERGKLRGLGEIARELEEEQDMLFEKWLDKVMRRSHEVGFENNYHTWSATRRAAARLKGEAFDVDQVFPFWERLRSWHYKYDKDVGFEGNSGMPCLACISEIDRDIYCVCVTNDDPATCVVCKHYDKKCGSIPSELLGAAQWYWNFVAGLDVQKPLLNRRQLWRIRRALEDCGSAWRELEEHLMNPNNLAMLALQESTASRKTLALSILQSASRCNLCLDEVHERIDFIQPGYNRDGNCVVTLRNALVHLSVSKDVVVCSVEEGKCCSLSNGSPSELEAAMNEASGSAPSCEVVHNGMPDYYRQ
ncbi:hypothetical protein FOXYSP1_12900 [Fusarium oxysporum f. sp. phaseoli]